MRKPSGRPAVARQEVAAVDKVLLLCMLAVCIIVTIYALRPDYSIGCSLTSLRAASCSAVSGK